MCSMPALKASCALTMRAYTLCHFARLADCFLFPGGVDFAGGAADDEAG